MYRSIQNFFNKSYLRRFICNKLRKSERICIILLAIFITIQLLRPKNPKFSPTPSQSNIACPVPIFPVIRDNAETVAKWTQEAKLCGSLDSATGSPNWINIEPGTGRIHFNLSAVLKSSAITKLKQPDDAFECSTQSIHWKDDFSSKMDPKPVRIRHNQLAPSMFFFVNCSTKLPATFLLHNSSGVSRSNYEMYHVAIRPDPQVLKRIGAASLSDPTDSKASKKSDVEANRYDILFIGLDSMSRLAWQQHLPKSYAYLTQKMSGHTYYKVNTLGDGTTVNLFGLLTGLKEWELPESRRSHANESVHLDYFPWIWRYASQPNSQSEQPKPKHAASSKQINPVNRINHYATMYLDDDTRYGTFEYRLKGWSEASGYPTDVYGRTFLMQADEGSLREKHRVCFGSKTRFRMFNEEFIRSFWAAYANVPKWALVFSGLSSHDANEPVKGLDDDFTRFLEEVHTNPLYQRTVLVLFSDHGHRFNSRLSMRGKYEERLPFLAVRLPDSFKTAYPEFAENFVSHHNRNQLVTLLDFFETQMELIKLPLSPLTTSANQSTGQVKQAPPAETKTHDGRALAHRQQSLFYRLPSNRTCSMIELEPHWCSCLVWKPIPLSDSLVSWASDELLHTINWEILIGNAVRAMCHWPLKLHRVISANLMVMSKSVIQFKNSKDHDGRVPDLSDESMNSKKTQNVIQIIIETQPGDAQFEASIGFFETNTDKNSNMKGEKRFFNIISNVKKIYRDLTNRKWIKAKKSGLDSDKIQRVNKYAKWVKCLDTNHEHLRKFCLCK